MRYTLAMALLIALSLSFPSHSVENLECQKNITINKEGSFYLDGTCKIMSITINHSNVNLDCKSAIINGQNQEPNGIFINGKEKKIKNIIVKNCKTTNHKSFGVWITAGIPKNRWSEDHNLNYSLAPENITLINISIANTKNAGVFVDSYSHNITVKNSIIKKAGDVGIYLEQSTRNNLIQGNLIANNGWGNPSNLREGLAIDSSSANKVVKNTFDNNASGGIFLYKNCGEFFHSSKSVIRWQHSEKNIIENNVFKNQKYGIWVASRQTKNLKRLQCGDNSVENKGIYYRDYADKNTINSNTFCNNEVAIRIESNNNIIKDNKIGLSHYILIPSKKIKEIHGFEVTGNTIDNNSKIKCK